METWQIFLAILIVLLFIVMPIYYASERKKKEQIKELQKIKEYGDAINKLSREKNKLQKQKLPVEL